MFGVGGGVIIVPLLRTFFGLSQHQAHGTSLAVMGPMALLGLLVYGAFSRVEWATGLLVALGSFVTARYGARWASRTSALRLQRAFAVLLALVAVRLLWQAPTIAENPLGEGLPRVAFDLVLGAAVGLLAGFMGVGGGMLAVPAFTLGLGMAQQVAQGTSLAVILVSGPAGALEHARHRNVVGRLVPMLVVGSMLGAPTASWLAQLFPHELLARVFALFLAANAVIGWIRARPSGGPPARPSRAEIRSARPHGDLIAGCNQRSAPVGRHISERLPRPSGS